MVLLRARLPGEDATFTLPELADTLTEMQNPAGVVSRHRAHTTNARRFQLTMADYSPTDFERYDGLGARQSPFFDHDIYTVPSRCGRSDDRADVVLLNQEKLRTVESDELIRCSLPP